MEDTIKIELLTPLAGTFIPNEIEQDWEEEEYCNPDEKHNSISRRIAHQSL